MPHTERQKGTVEIHIKYMKLAMELDLKFHLTGVL